MNQLSGSRPTASCPRFLDGGKETRSELEARNFPHAISLCQKKADRGIITEVNDIGPMRRRPDSLRGHCGTLVVPSGFALGPRVAAITARRLRAFAPVHPPAYAVRYCGRQADSQPGSPPTAIDIMFMLLISFECLPARMLFRLLVHLSGQRPVCPPARLHACSTVCLLELSFMEALAVPAGLPYSSSQAATLDHRHARQPSMGIHLETSGRKPNSATSRQNR